MHKKGGFYAFRGILTGNFYSPKGGGLRDFNSFNMFKL